MGHAMTIPLDTHPRLLGAEPGPPPLDAYRGADGRERLIAAVEESGLRGRGGGGFPTGRKLRAVAANRGPATVLVNACESEPVSAKDHALLGRAPHLVLDGAVLAAHVVRAGRIVVCLPAGDPLGHALSAVLATRADPVPVHLQPVPHRYVASEESALVNLLNTGDARPTTRPPRPDQQGVLISNTETFAHVALIARHGPDWFRTTGTPDSPGTMLVTVGGAVREPGVREVACGTPVGEVLAGADPDATALLVGGIAGTWLPLPASAAVPLAHRELAGVGATLGVGALFVLPPDACGLAETARIVRYLAGESAGQCGPCVFGLPAIADDLVHLVHGHADVLPRLRHRAGITPGRGACRHPDGVARVATSALHVFAADVERHLTGQPCVYMGRSYVPLSRREPR
jgi:NADH:ubiquinone oxidoreductase subunit F (NADH-binding)